MTLLVRFTAPCPAGHPDARWVSDPGTGERITADAFTVRCRACEPPPVVTVSNPRPSLFRPPWRAA